MKKRPEYIRFEEKDVPPSFKTRMVAVLTVRSGVRLGTISWYAPWRQYTFRPEPDTIFNNGCLWDIKQQIERMNADHRRAQEMKVS